MCCCGARTIASSRSNNRLEVLGGYLIAYLNLDKVIKIIRTEDEPKPVLMKAFKLSDVQADAILNMRLRNLRKLEEMEIRKEDKELRAERKELAGTGQVRKSAVEKNIGEHCNGSHGVRTEDRTRQTPNQICRSAGARRGGDRRSDGRSRADHRLWSRRRAGSARLRGHVSDLEAIAFKSDDRLKFAFPAETTSKILAFATNGRFYTLEASKLPGGRGHGEPVRLFVDLEQDGDLVAVMPYVGGRKFLVASHGGNGFVVSEDEAIANTRKGKQVLNLKAPDRAVRLPWSRANLSRPSATIERLLVFPLDQVPEMTRGRGVRLQRFKDGGLSDIKTFTAADGLTWIDTAGRSFSLTLKELADWRGERAAAGRLPPKGFPRTNKFG